jgi:hypothetical protein
MYDTEWAYRLGRIGYDAYGEVAEWKNYEGKPMPKWDELPQHIRDKWAAAASAIRHECLGRETQASTGS